MDATLAGPLGVAAERIIVTADRLGNTGSAAIWLALTQSRPTLKPGQTVLALGAEATDFMFGGFRYHHA
jgi:3-oxoacyl-[acyl-carrier-protein] synthase III